MLDDAGGPGWCHRRSNGLPVLRLAAHSCEDKLAIGDPLSSRLGNGSAEGLEGDAVWLRPAAYARVQCVDFGKLRGCELEVEDVEVLRDPFGPYRLGDC